MVPSSDPSTLILNLLATSCPLSKRLLRAEAPPSGHVHAHLAVAGSSLEERLVVSQHSPADQPFSTSKQAGAGGRDRTTARARRGPSTALYGHARHPLTGVRGCRG